MDLVKGVLFSMKQLYNDINPATLTGAIDVIVVEKPNGELASTPFHVRFGKMNVMNFVGKTVEIYINDAPTDLRMKLGPSGEAFFVEASDEEPPAYLATSPLPDDSLLHELPTPTTPSPHSDSSSALGANHSPRKRSDSSPAVVVANARSLSSSSSSKKILSASTTSTSATTAATTTTASADENLSTLPSLSASVVTASTLRETATFPKETTSESDNDAATQGRLKGAGHSLTSGKKHRSPSREHQKQQQLQLQQQQQLQLPVDKVDDGSSTGERAPSESVSQRNEGSSSPGERSTVTKVKKRRRKSSKQVAAEKSLVPPESSSSDLEEETQFVMDGVEEPEENATTSTSDTALATTTSTTTPTLTAEEEGSLVLSSQEMKTARTTQRNASSRKDKNASSSHKNNNNNNNNSSRETAREPAENNTSNTTVTSDDEFNWTSVASGVAPARLTPAGLPPVTLTSATASLTSKAVSDGDLSDSDRLQRDRPPSPARSDTLVELGHAADDDEPGGVEWSWGELPEGEMPPQVRPPSPLMSPAIPEEESGPIESDPISHDSSRRVDGTPRTPTAAVDSVSPDHCPASAKATTSTPTSVKQAGGLYLDDVLAQTDPAMRARYIGSCPRRAPARLAGRTTSGHEDGESGNGPSLSQSPQSGLDSDCEPEIRHPVFDYRLRKYSDLAMSLCGFDKISDDDVEERFLAHLVTYDAFCENPDILHEPNLVFRMNGKYYNWKCVAPQLLSLAMFQTALPAHTMDKLRAEHLPKKKASSPPQKYRGWWWSRGGPQEEAVDADSSKQDMSPLKPKDSDTVLPKDQAPTEAQNHIPKVLSDEEVLAKQLLEEERKKPHNKKSLRLSSDQLKALGLKPGTNFAEFKVITAYQGTSVCSCHIYLWKSTDKIVISDIDGTITKSDVLGHILPIIGKDWAQSGVASLFNKIHRNGYKLLYLSARAIGQAEWTRGFLRTLKQDNFLLPDGPVLLNPTSLLSALHREVVAKNPHIFKINCLKDVKQLFNGPDGTPGRPFYAGFGNKVTDALSYKSVSVPVNRIFTINHRGEISQELLGNVGRTYHCLGDIADLIFPPLEPSKEAVKEQFSSFSYWKEPLPDVDIKDLPKNAPSPSDSAKAHANSTSTKDAKDAKISPKKGQK